MKNGIPVNNNISDEKQTEGINENKLIICESIEQFEHLIMKDKVTVVDFTATWCGPCKKIAPFFEELVSIYTDINFVKVDVDENEDVITKYDVTAMPTFQFWKNGIRLHAFSGADPNMLLEIIKKII